MAPAIPEGWIDYTNTGRQISGTRFIAFKTPLRMNVCGEIGPAFLFTTRDLVDSCSSLGLVINLTFKGKSGYYNFEDITNAGVEYKQLPIPGKVIPETKYVFNFFQIVEKFLQENECNDKLIGVHCTHGLNRTGYLVCRYMIDRLNVPPDQAIIEFNSARGHEQERKIYLDDLRNKQLSDQYRNWVKIQSANNPNTVIPLTPEITNRRFHNREVENRSPQMSRKRKNAEILDSGEYSNHKRMKYSSSAILPPPEYHDSYSNRRHSYDGSPSLGKSYYQQYYRGHVHPQYHMDYYHPRGTDYGPSLTNNQWTPYATHSRGPRTPRNANFTPRSNRGSTLRRPERFNYQFISSFSANTRASTSQPSTSNARGPPVPTAKEVTKPKTAPVPAANKKKTTIAQKVMEKLKFKKANPYIGKKAKKT